MPCRTGKSSWERKPGGERGDQATQVERARIEQLEKQLRQLSAQAARRADEQQTLGTPERRRSFGALGLQEEAGAGRKRAAHVALTAAKGASAGQRAAQLAARARLWSRHARARAEARPELTSIEALRRRRSPDQPAGSEWLRAAGSRGAAVAAHSRSREAGSGLSKPSWRTSCEKAVCVERRRKVGGVGELRRRAASC